MIIVIYALIKALKKENDKISLLNLLHDLGIVFNYGDFKENIKRINILNPKWVTVGIDKIINHNNFFQKDGKITINDVRYVLANTRDKEGKKVKYKGKEKFIIGLMKQFELCFEIPEEASYLVPLLLKEKQPSLGLRFNDSLKLMYEYKFLPKSIISRFITKTHGISLEYWQHGCILQSKDKQNEALIQVNYPKKQISIYVNNLQTSRHILLSDIREKFKPLNKEIQPKPQIFVFRKNDSNNPISYKRLKEAGQAGQTEIYVENRGSLKIASILNNYETNSIVDFREALQAEQTEIYVENRGSLKIASILNNYKTNPIVDFKEAVQQELADFKSEQFIPAWAISAFFGIFLLFYGSYILKNPLIGIPLFFAIIRLMYWLSRFLNSNPRFLQTGYLILLSIPPISYLGIQLWNHFNTPEKQFSTTLNIVKESHFIAGSLILIVVAIIIIIRNKSTSKKNT